MRTTPRSRLLLIELICDFIIFSLCAVVCVTLLSQARSMSRESSQLTEAVYIAQDAAERYRAGLPVYSSYFTDGTPDTSTLDPLLKSSVPEYSVSLSEEGALVQISVFSSFPMEDPVPLYTLTVRKEEAAP